MIPIERYAVAGHRPQPSRQFIRHSDRGFVVAAAFGGVELPGMEAVERLSRIAWHYV